MADQSSVTAGYGKAVRLLTGLCLVFLAFTWWLLSDWKLSLSLDAAMYVSGAMTLLDGGKLYVDFVDLNPPLATYLHMPAVLLGEFLDIPPISGFYCLLFSATLWSSFTIYRLLAETSSESRLRALLVCLAPIFLLFTAAPDAEMGQRPHLFFLAAVPYLILRFNRAQNAKLGLLNALFIGCVIGLAASLKPVHYAVILASAETYLLLKHRNWRSLLAPEVMAAVLAVAGYGIFIMTLPAESKEVFFDFLIPLIVESYDVFGQNPVELTRRAIMHLAGPLSVALACNFLLRKDAANYRGLAEMLAVTSFAAAAVYLAQFKGWPYHALYSIGCAYLILGITLGSARPNLLQYRIAGFAAAKPILVISFALCLGAAQSTLRAAKDAHWKLKSLDAIQILEETAPDDKIMVISTSVHRSYPLLFLTDRRPATRYPFMFPIPLLYEGAERDPSSPYQYRIHVDREAAEQRFLATLNEDIEKHRPALIFLESQFESPRYDDPVYNEGFCNACPPGMHIPEYLSAHGAELPALGNYGRVAYNSWVQVLRRIEDH